jgi:beta-lactamase superfamily II metal-dependent hydrolase
MGDVPGRVEATLLAMYPDLKADVLKVGHHGAQDATTKAFLQRIQPKIAVVCVNQGNVRGYPAPEVLRRLRAFGARVFVTGKDGTILVSTDGQSLKVSCGGDRPPWSTEKRDGRNIGNGERKK